MKLLERYIFWKLARAFLLSLVTLSVTVWLTQALRQFDLVSAMGQSVGTFFQITLLLLPSLATVVAPIALLIAVMFTYGTLNSGSELVVINASGARQSVLLKPVILIAVGVALFMSAMTLYFSPLSLRVWRELITNVRGSVINSVLREGEFLALANGLMFQLRKRASNGTLEGIFLTDVRDPQESVDYIAERGAILDSPLGVFLVMRDGTIQRRKTADKSIAIIQFTSYAFDLSTFTSRGETRSYRPNERSTVYLLRPDPDDKYYRQHPEKYRSELLTRLSTPLNAFVFGILPLIFLAQAETTRRRRTATVLMSVGSVTGVAVVEFVLSGMAETSTIAAIALFAVPILAAAAGIALVLSGVQPRPPEKLLIFSDRVAARFAALLRPAAAMALRR